MNRSFFPAPPRIIRPRSAPRNTITYRNPPAQSPPKKVKIAPAIAS